MVNDKKNKLRFSLKYTHIHPHKHKIGRRNWRRICLRRWWVERDVLKRQKKPDDDDVDDVCFCSEETYTG